jgi:hypothetical protein
MFDIRPELPPQAMPQMQPTQRPLTANPSALQRPFVQMPEGTMNERFPIRPY